MLQKLLCYLGSHIWVVSHVKSSVYEFISSKDIEKHKESGAYIITYEVQKCLCCKKEKRKEIGKTRG